MNDNVAEKNIDKFLKAYGGEGFLRLFFANYLFEIVNYYLHSEGKDDYDPSHLMLFNYKNKPYSKTDREIFDKLLMKECITNSDIIIQYLNQKNNKIFSTDLLENEYVKKLIIKAFDEILDKMR